MEAEPCLGQQGTIFSSRALLPTGHHEHVQHEVPFALLQAIAELPEVDLHRGLAHLQAAELPYETRLFPERAFTFKHALTHEVTYGSFLQGRRWVLHARIVEALEALPTDRPAEQVNRLTHHAMRDAVWDKALACGRL
jgi:hypothetical protein